MDKPTNKFREQIEQQQMSEEELMLRDQIIMARAMEANHTLAKINQHTLELSLVELTSLQEFMQGRPVSPGLAALTEAARIQVEAAKKAMEPPAVARADLVQLAALHAAIALANLNTAERIADEARTNVKERVHFVAGPDDIPTQDIKSPIEDDGFGRSDEDQDTADDEPEEEHEMVDPNEVPVKLER